jgi:hypothetical protein
MTNYDVNKKVVKVKVYAGSARDGQVLLTLINPENQNDNLTTTNMKDFFAFCSERRLLPDADFVALVKKCLNQTHNGLTVPEEVLADNVTSSSYLKKNFPDHY